MNTEEKNKGSIKNIWNQVNLSKMLMNTVVLLEGVIFIFLVICKGQTLEFRYDEAYTYLNYAKDFSIDQIPYLFKHSLANNHWLNTMLIHFVQEITKQYYNDFLIRLPNIVASVCFVGLTMYLFYKQKISFLTAELLLMNNCAVNWFFQARGNGLGLFFVFVALCAYNIWLQHDESNDWIIIIAAASFCIATYAETYMIFVFAPFVIIVFYKLFLRNRIIDFIRRHLLFIVFAILSQVTIFIYSLNISAEGMPRPGDGISIYNSMFRGWIAMLPFRSGNIVKILSTMFFLATVILLLIFRKKIIKSNFVAIFIGYVTLAFIAMHVFHIEYPIDRMLLPLTPLYAFWIDEVARVWGTSLSPRLLKGNLQKIILICGVVFCTIFFFYGADAQLSSIKTTTNRIKDKVYMAAYGDKVIQMKDEPNNPSFDYYEGQLLTNYGITVTEQR